MIQIANLADCCAAFFSPASVSITASPAAAGSWPGLLAHLGKPGAEVRVLETGYRVPRQILDYANQLLGALAPGLAPAWRHGDDLSLYEHPRP